MESYAHKLAKQVVIDWLRDSAKGNLDKRTNDPLGLMWRVNRPAPLWGVFEEYPVLEDETGLLPVWDETGLGVDDGPPPTVQKLLRHGKKPKAVLDIAVQHKGYIAYAIEIVHKNPPSNEKLSWLRRCADRPSLLVLPARWVLGQVAPPKPPIPQEFWYW